MKNFLKMQENDNYSKDIMHLVIFYLVVDIILALISYTATFGASIVMAFVGVFIRTTLFYLIARMNLSLQSPVLGSIFYLIMQMKNGQIIHEQKCSIYFMWYFWASLTMIIRKNFQIISILK